MSLIPVARVWTYDALATGTSLGGHWNYSGLDFNTENFEIETSNGSVTLSFLDPDPVSFTSAVGELLWFECSDDFTETRYSYAGGSSVSVDTVADSISCGYTPPTPPAPTCDLVLDVDVVGDVITASASGAHGAVKYSIDGGITRQVSGKFADLAPKSYVVMAYDAGSPDCTRSMTVLVVATPPGISPVPGALPAIAFAGNPIALIGQATRPGRALLLELFVETAHGSARYNRLVQRLRPTDSTGKTVIELQKQLAAALTPDRPDLSREPGLRRLTTSIRRYYAALAEIQPGTGQPGPFVFEAPRTVLQGGLSWPAARAGNFFAPLPARFLTWRPNLVQEIGLDHVILHSALIAANESKCTALVKCFEKGEGQPFEVLTYSLQFLQGSSLPVRNDSDGRQGDEGRAGYRSLDPPTPRLLELQVPVSALPENTYRVSVQFYNHLNTTITEKRQYRIDDNARRRQFIFLNSLGQWDTLSCYGPRAGKISMERTVATTLPAPNYDPQSGTDAVVSVNMEERTTISTGMVTPDEQHWLRELHTSREAYEVAGTELRKIRLTTKDFINYVDDGGSEGFTFEYQYCFDTLPYAPYDWL